AAALWHEVVGIHVDQSAQVLWYLKLPSKFDYGLTTLCPSASRYTGLATSYQLIQAEIGDVIKQSCGCNQVVTNSQCLNRRLDSQSLIAAEVAAWEKKRNLAKARIHWTFTLAAARRKLRKLYPSIED